MKRFLPIAVLALSIMQSCKEGKSASSATMLEKNTATMAAPNTTEDDFVAMLGSYSGAFGDNKITVLLTTITKDSVRGSSIVAGNNRPFEGTVTKSEDGKLMLAAREPGTDLHDGTFNFELDAKNLNILAGAWQPYKTEAGAAKNFLLAKKIFKYDPTTGISEASERLLKTKDLENEDKYYLSFMRNEIFARHGYSFSRKETREMFESEDWYVPRSTNVIDELTEIEKKNIALLKKYEKYAVDYGDDFGR